MRSPDQKPLRESSPVKEHALERTLSLSRMGTRLLTLEEALQERLSPEEYKSFARALRYFFSEQAINFRTKQYRSSLQKFLNHHKDFLAIVRKSIQISSEKNPYVLSMSHEHVAHHEDNVLSDAKRALATSMNEAFNAFEDLVLHTEKLLAITQHKTSKIRIDKAGIERLDSALQTLEALFEDDTAAHTLIHRDSSLGYSGSNRENLESTLQELEQERHSLRLLHSYLNRAVATFSSSRFESSVPEEKRMQFRTCIHAIHSYCHHLEKIISAEYDLWHAFADRAYTQGVYDNLVLMLTSTAGVDQALDALQKIAVQKLSTLTPKQVKQTRRQKALIRLLKTMKERSALTVTKEMRAHYEVLALKKQQPKSQSVVR